MKHSLLFLSALLLASPVSGEDAVPVGLFSQGRLNGWETEKFDGVTQYSLSEDNGIKSLLAVSRNAASGLYREIEVDLERTPILQWSWKVENLIDSPDEHSKAGDDYPARIYVVFSGGLAFWRTRAINYVWSSNQEAGSTWPNAYTANARMIAVRGTDAPLHTWLSESRDVRADYRRLFGEPPGVVAAVALMTDTDNTGQEARAWYGDIRFVSAK